MKKHNGFTLVEMIGVLAVIAILASLLVPRIIEVTSKQGKTNTPPAVVTNSVTTNAVGVTNR